MEKHLKVTATSATVIVLAVVAVAIVGGHFSAMNREWYDRLVKPPWQPPNWAFPIAWNTIFILAIISIILIWNTHPRTALTYWTIAAFILNGILNVAWSALFFGSKLIYPAIFDAGLICLSVVVITILAWPISRVAGLLLLPYAGWTAFATYLTAVIYRLNP